MCISVKFRLSDQSGLTSIESTVQSLAAILVRSYRISQEPPVSTPYQPRILLANHRITYLKNANAAEGLTDLDNKTVRNVSTIQISHLCSQLQLLLRRARALVACQATQAAGYCGSVPHVTAQDSTGQVTPPGGTCRAQRFQ
jgi:hypothetical protein